MNTALIQLKEKDEAMNKDAYCILKIRKRPFYIWVLRAAWFIWLIFWAEVALGSRAELEPRALTISLVIFLLSLLAGLVLWIIGLTKFQRGKKKN